MLRSMLTAISSLNLNQNYMDVIANNLSNANTTGFKASRFSFQDQFTQLLNVGTAPSTSQGGTNPTQIGLGVRLGNISPLFTQGSLQSTGRNSDLAIVGDGFLMYANNGKTFYSRDGMLTMDSDGYLVHGSSGMKLQGWQATQNGLVSNLATNVPPGNIRLPLDTTLARPTGKTNLVGNLDSTAANNGTFTATLGVYDSLGVYHNLALTFTKSSDNTWNWSVSGDGATRITDTTTPITFNAAGQFLNAAGQISLPGAQGAATQTINVDFSKMTQLASASSVNMADQDGLAAGGLSSFQISSGDGKIYGLYSNGMQQLIGQVAVARFINPMGLIHNGENMWLAGINSGEPNVGEANTNGRGTVASSTLEGSNVDMAQEFTNMILAQRGFQASSRIITTSDEMLQELVNLKR